VIRRFITGHVVEFDQEQADAVTAMLDTYDIVFGEVDR
jgi:hypothetical protein